jgi:hypothetical protein
MNKRLSAYKILPKLLAAIAAYNSGHCQRPGVWG